MVSELIFNLILCLGIIFYLVQALLLPHSVNSTDILGASGFPLILGGLGLVVLFIITCQVVRRRKKIHITMFQWRSIDGRSVAFNVVLLFVYIMILNVIGFVLATFFYLPIAGWSIGYRKSFRLLLFSLIVTAVTTLVFGKLFVVPLPRGIGALRELSYYIY